MAAYIGVIYCKATKCSAQALCTCSNLHTAFHWAEFSTFWPWRSVPAGRHSTPDCCPAAWCGLLPKLLSGSSLSPLRVLAELSGSCEYCSLSLQYANKSHYQLTLLQNCSRTTAVSGSTWWQTPLALSVAASDQFCPVLSTADTTLTQVSAQVDWNYGLMLDNLRRSASLLVTTKRIVPRLGAAQSGTALS